MARYYTPQVAARRARMAPARDLNPTEAAWADLIANGAFATDTIWSKGTGWGIADGVATHTGVTASNIVQPVPIIAGATYRFVWTISGRTAGSLKSRLNGGTAVSGDLETTDAEHTQDLVAKAGNTDAGVRASSDFDGSVDDLSVTRIA